MTAFSVKILNPDDWEMYRNLRLEALKTEPHAYPANYETEAAFNEKQWRKRASSSVAQGFVLLAEKQPVGLCSLIRHHPATGLISHKYIQPDYRGLSGVAMDLTRMEWAKDKGIALIEAMPRQVNEKSCQRLAGWGLSYEGIINHEIEPGQIDLLALYRGNTLDILERLQARQARVELAYSL